MYFVDHPVREGTWAPAGKFADLVLMIVVCAFVCLAIADDCHLPVLGSGPDSKGRAVRFIFTKGMLMAKECLVCVGGWME